MHLKIGLPRDLKVGGSPLRHSRGFTPLFHTCMIELYAYSTSLFLYRQEFFVQILWICFWSVRRSHLRSRRTVFMSSHGRSLRSAAELE